MTPRRSKQRGPLSEEDVRLWEMMKQRLEPLRNAKRRITDHETNDAASPRVKLAEQAPGSRDTSATVPGHSAGSRPPHGPPAAAHPVPRKSTFVPALHPVTMPIERRKSRLLAKGHRPIEAVLDLHGMRQREAHLALCHFVAASHARGLKFVKIITGKGVRPGDDHHRHRPFDAPHEGERGVLKRLVPEWLREPGVGTLVVGFSSAGRGHGGEGALYVELRRKGRVSG